MMLCGKKDPERNDVKNLFDFEHRRPVPSQNVVMGDLSIPKMPPMVGHGQSPIYQIVTNLPRVILTFPA